MKRHFPKKANKKGAIELSMTTIIIVIIGITLLTLGLRWVYNIFGQIERQREQIGAAMEKQILDTFGESEHPINLLATSKTVRQGEFFDLGIAIRNTLPEKHKFKYDVKVAEIPANAVESEVLSWFMWTKEEIELDSGELFADHISIYVPKARAPLGRYRMNIELNCVDVGCDEKDFKTFTLIVTGA